MKEEGQHSIQQIFTFDDKRAWCNKHLKIFWNIISNPPGTAIAV